jgi:site-specific recombinase XerD
MPTRSRRAGTTGSWKSRSRGGKGGKDGVGFFGAEAAQMLRASLASRREVVPEDSCLWTAWGRSLTRHHAAHILYGLAKKAALTRKIGPHALGHHASTSILKQTGDLELVRQVLRHETLAMVLRYAIFPNESPRPTCTLETRRHTHAART